MRCDAMDAPEDPTRTVWARHDRRKFNLNWLEWANVLQALFPGTTSAIHRIHSNSNISNIIIIINNTLTAEEDGYM